jgi:hypothetical protein
MPEPPSVRWDRIKVGVSVAMLAMGFVHAIPRSTHLSKPVTRSLAPGVTRSMSIGNLIKPVSTPGSTLGAMGIIEGQEIMAGIASRIVRIDFAGIVAMAVILMLLDLGVRLVT